MASITRSLERCLQKCSLNQPDGGGEEDVVSDGGPGNQSGTTSSDSSDSDDDDDDDHTTLNVPFFHNNGSVSLPCWEQCPDLKTAGEIYYVNWVNGMEVRGEDPRNNNYTQVKEEEDSYYDSEESSTSDSSSYPSSSSSTTTDTSCCYHRDRGDDDNYYHDDVLVVAGCKSCLMYFMLPKGVQECPKCTTFLLHFHHPTTSQN